MGEEREKRWNKTWEMLIILQLNYGYAEVHYTFLSAFGHVKISKLKSKNK